MFIQILIMLLLSIENRGIIRLYILSQGSYPYPVTHLIDGGSGVAENTIDMHVQSRKKVDISNKVKTL